MDGGGPGIPGAGSAPGEQAVAFAAELIDRSGRAPFIEAALAHRPGGAGRCRCAPRSPRCCAWPSMTDRCFDPATPAAVPADLSRVPPAAGCAWHRHHPAGHPGRLPPGPVLRRPDPHRGRPLGAAENRRLAQDELTARAKPITPEQATAARDRLETLVNALLETSVSVLTGDERAAFDGSTGLDATPVRLFSRGPSKRAGLSASDPDGGW